MGGYRVETSQLAVLRASPPFGCLRGFLCGHEGQGVFNRGTGASLQCCTSGSMNSGIWKQMLSTIYFLKARESLPLAVPQCQEKRAPESHSSQLWLREGLRMGSGQSVFRGASPV